MYYIASMAETFTETPEERTTDALQIVAAILLGVAATLTAVAAFNAALKDGEALQSYTESTRQLSDANFYWSTGNGVEDGDFALFVEYAAASQEDEDLAGYFYDLMRPEMQEAIDWWAKPENEDVDDPFDTDAGSPYYVEQYDAAQSLEEQANASFEDGASKDDNGDQFELAAVFFALTLFFGGIATLFANRRVTVALLSAAGVTIVIGGITLFARLLEHARVRLSASSSGAPSGLEVLEVLEVAARGGAALALVLRATCAAAVRLVGGGGHLHEADLADLHSRVERDRQTGDVGELERDVPVEPGVDEPGGRVDQQSEAAERRLALDTSDQVVGHADAFQGGAEHELAGMQHERLVAVDGDLDEFGEVDHVLLDVDDAASVVAEHPEEVRDPHVDRRRLDERLVERVDHDPAGGELFTDGAVGQDHDRPR